MNDEQPAGGAHPPAGSALGHLTRRRFLAAATVGTAGLAGEGLGWGPRRLGFSHHDLTPRPASAARPVRLIQISDLHLHSVGAMHRRMADRVGRLRPDLLLFTGDAVDRADRLDTLAELLALLPRVPGYAILGNWEHWSGVDLGALEALYLRNETRLLVNATVTHEVRGARLVITGLDDLAGGSPDVARALDGAPDGDAHLLLGHCPEQRDQLPATAGTSTLGSLPAPLGFDWRRITAMLSGHTHGGQVKLGGWAPVTPPGSGRYVEGWYRDAGQVPMYVSRGIGTSMAPVRFGCPPEVAVFDWWPETRAG